MRSFAFGIALLTLLPTSAAWGHGYEIEGLTIEHPWSRATPPAAKVAAGYMVIVNGSLYDERLLAVESDAATRSELHEMIEEQGIMKMRPLADGISVPAGGTVALEPGGLHVMFLDIAAPFVAGESIPAVLHFERAGALAVEFRVEAMGHQHDHSHDHDHQHDDAGDHKD